MMEDEEHITKRFDGQKDKEEKDVSAKMINIWRSKLLNSANANVDKKEIGGDLTASKSVDINVDKFKKAVGEFKPRESAVTISLSNLIKKK